VFCVLGMCLNDKVWVFWVTIAVASKAPLLLSPLQPCQKA
jgi:hypothetical protein